MLQPSNAFDGEFEEKVSVVLVLAGVVIILILSTVLAIA